MSYGIYLSVFLSFLCGAVSFSKAHSRHSDWNQLRVTYGKFDTLPLNSKDAENEKWKRDASCSDKPRNFFQGYRYVKDGDKSTRLLYDCDGNIAGMQATITPSPLFPTTHNSFPWHSNPGGSVTATMYFRNPKRICRCKKKPCKDKDKPVVGDRIWLQLEKGGRKSRAMMKMPLTVKEMKNTPWVEGECVGAMGVHYHYNISKTFDCDYALPVFLLVNKQTGKVHGFGWAVPLTVKNTQRWEYPPPAIFGRSIKAKDMPACIVKYKSVSVQHIYFVDPLRIDC